MPNLVKMSHLSSSATIYIRQIFYLLVGEPAELRGAGEGGERRPPPSPLSLVGGGGGGSGVRAQAGPLPRSLAFVSASAAEARLPV